MEKLIFGLKIAALGMGSVFIALYALNLIIGLLEKTVGPKQENILDQPQTTTEQAKTDLNATEAQEENEEGQAQLVAVIAAALATQGITVNQIKTITPLCLNPGPTPITPPWAFAGRQTIMQKRKIKA